MNSSLCRNIDWLHDPTTMVIIIVFSVVKDSKEESKDSRSNDKRCEKSFHYSSPDWVVSAAPIKDAKRMAAKRSPMIRRNLGLVSPQTRDDLSSDSICAESSDDAHHGSASVQLLSLFVVSLVVVVHDLLLNGWVYVHARLFSESIETSAVLG